MDQQSVAILTERIDAVERQNRGLRRLLLGVIFFVTALTVISQWLGLHVADAQSSRLVVQSLTIRDAAGANRIVLNADQVLDGRFAPVLRINDYNGLPKVDIELDRESLPSLVLFGPFDA